MRFFLLFLIFIVTITLAQNTSIFFDGIDSETSRQVVIDSIVIENQNFNYREKFVFHDSVGQRCCVLTGIDEVVITEEYELNLQPNFPNPFDYYTEFKIEVPKQQNLQINLFNVLGENIASHRGEYAAGIHSFKLDAKGLNSGIYFVSVLINNQVKSRKITKLSDKSGSSVQISYQGKDYSLKKYMNRINYLFSSNDQYIVIGYSNEYLADTLVNIDINKNGNYQFKF